VITNVKFFIAFWFYFSFNWFLFSANHITPPKYINECNLTVTKEENVRASNTKLISLSVWAFWSFFFFSLKSCEYIVKSVWIKKLHKALIENDSNLGSLAPRNAVIAERARAKVFKIRRKIYLSKLKKVNLVQIYRLFWLRNIKI